MLLISLGTSWHYLNVEKLRFKTRGRISKEERLILSKQNLDKFEKLTFKWINLSFCCFFKFVFVPMCYSSFWLIKNRMNLSQGGWCHYFKIKLIVKKVKKSGCFKRTYLLSVNDFRVATLSKVYLTVI